MIDMTPGPAQHVHSAIDCSHDSEGPSIWWLCGYEPKFTRHGEAAPNPYDTPAATDSFGLPIQPWRDEVHRWGGDAA